MPVTTRRGKATASVQGIPDNLDSLSQFSDPPSRAASEDSDWVPAGGITLSVENLGTDRCSHEKHRGGRRIHMEAHVRSVLVPTIMDPGTRGFLLANWMCSPLYLLTLYTKYERLFRTRARSLICHPTQGALAVDSSRSSQPCAD